jgi:hypothetical protein
MESEKINMALPYLRIAYEMTLKSVVLEEDKEIRDSYNKIFKKIEKDEIFNNILKKSILTYVYNCLCRYSHATKINEFVYLIQKNDILKEYLMYI